MQYYLDVLLERPLVQRVLLIAALVLTLAALDYALVYRHQAGRVVRITGEIELARLQEAQLRAELSRLPQLRKEVAALRRELHSRLPRRTGASTPLENIGARAAMAGLEVIRFHPGAARHEEHFTEIPMEVEFKGSFHDLLNFFELSAESRDLLNTTNLAIDALANADAADGRTLLRIALKMATLRLPPEEADTAAEAGAVPRAATRAPDPTPAATPARTDAGPPLRDPFQPYQAPAPPKPERQSEPAPAHGHAYEPLPAPRFQAVGIVWENRTAVALVKDAEGFAHVVQPGEQLGDHLYRVKTITPCQVILETPRNVPDPQETRMKLRRCGTFEHAGDPRAVPADRQE